ncbi:MAG: F0F1 ATP synthase subunit A [Candidatus Pacebacteria bacterium]|nr:F0F1 ATP synthase subunit A [Candidatus Paceibacterota bacterium]
MEEGLHIALGAERLGELYGIPITNALLAGWIVTIFLVLVAVLVGRRVRLIPGRVQNVFELIFDFMLGYMETVLGSRALAIRYFPLISTLFLFILFSNLFHFLPFISAITYTEHGHTAHLLRASTTDLNFTLALAIVAVISIEVAGIAALGFFRYGSKFINFSSPLNFVVGIIELVSELSRFISFSFRLFGNIFAGEVLLAVIALFVPYLLPVPLMAFELFVAFIQATVFAMLTLFFIKLAIAMPHGAGEHGDGHKEGAHA